MKYTGPATTIDNNRNDPYYKAKGLCYCTLGCQTMRHCCTVVSPAGYIAGYEYRFLLTCPVAGLMLHLEQWQPEFLA